MLLWKSKLVKMTRAAKVIWQQHSVTGGLKWLHSHGAGCGLGHVSPEGPPGLLHLVPKAAGERTSANLRASSHLHWPHCLLRPLGVSKSCRGSGEGVKRGGRQGSMIPWGHSCHDLPVPSSWTPIFHFSLSLPEGDYGSMDTNLSYKTQLG